jgi:hypothetical protein
MAYLGYNGIITFQRNPPEPIAIPVSAINKTDGYISADYDDWLLAEQVTIVHSTGTLNGYIFRNELDRIFFHTTIAGALSNSTATRISLSSVSISTPLILAANTNAEQDTVLSQLLSSLTGLTSETRLRAWPSTAAAFKNAASSDPWNLQGELRSWELNRSASEIDTGSIGEKFGTSIKSVVTGSGSMDFLIDIYIKNNQTSVDPILRLVQLTDEGSTASGKFYLKGQENDFMDADSIPLSKSYFFKSKILITASSISMSPDNAVIGSAQFVTTGPIRLLSD